MNAEQAKVAMHNVVGRAAKRALADGPLSDFVRGHYCGELSAISINAERSCARDGVELNELYDKLRDEIINIDRRAAA